jgi:hypothetical protein
MNKIHTLLTISLFVFYNASAQIPNASFENWTPFSSTCATGEYPTGWQTTDSLSQCLAAGNSAIRNGGPEKCDMLYSIKLTSVNVPFPPVKGPGVATNGTLTPQATVAGGSPDTARSAQFSGCYKYTPVANDTGYITAVLFRWNGTSRDTIASTKLMLLDTNATMVSFSSNFVYKDWANQPDTILITLQSSPALNNAQPGSTLFVDSLGLSGYVGFDERASVIIDINIYPQPAQNELNIQVELYRNIALTYEIADITGRKILSGKMESMNQKVDISSLNRGNYFVALRNEQGTILHTSKLLVSK